MANGEEKIIKSEDFYAVLGLDKECNQTELKNAYKKLAMRWHPDRCSASGNSKFVEEANTKFQAIQQAYSVLSNADKRFLYDVGVYDNDDDDDNNGMGDFLNEMAGMMHQAKPNENGEESFEQLQELFEEMFNGDVDLFGTSTTSSCNQSSKRNSSEMNSGMCSFNADFQNFCVGVSNFLIGLYMLSLLDSFGQVTDPNRTPQLYGGTSKGGEGNNNSRKRCSRRNCR
ncbi:hypothetical protein ACFE04_021757 [Oxalis oulophora]